MAIKITIALLAALFCVIIPRLRPSYERFAATWPLLHFFILGAFVAFSLVASVIFSSGPVREFLYAGF